MLYNPKYMYVHHIDQIIVVKAKPVQEIPSQWHVFRGFLQDSSQLCIQWSDLYTYKEDNHY